MGITEILEAKRDPILRIAQRHGVGMVRVFGSVARGDAHNDSATVNKRIDVPRGHAENPMTNDEVVAKFGRMADRVISDDGASKIFNRAWNLDKLTDLTPLFAFKVLDA